MSGPGAISLGRQGLRAISPMGSATDGASTVLAARVRKETAFPLRRRSGHDVAVSAFANRRSRAEAASGQPPAS